MEFPIEEVRAIFPNATVEKAKHYASIDRWTRKNFVYCYGGVTEEEYPKENRRLQEALEKWARSVGLV